VQSREHGRDGRDGDTSVTVMSGERARLRCSVHAIPEPQITWYKNGVSQPLDGAGGHLLSRDGRRLEITAASVDDAARYTCIARNLAGEVEKHIDLSVHGIPLRLESRPSTTQLCRACY